MIKSFYDFYDAIHFIDDTTYRASKADIERMTVEMKFINHQWRVGIRFDDQQLEFKFDDSNSTT